MNYEEIKKKNLAGFTLIELLASVAIFSLIVGGASGIFISAIRTQRKTLSNQELLDQTSYLIEYMSRALRMAKKDVTGICISPNLNYAITRSGEGIKFMNSGGSCQEFYLSGDQLKEEKAGVRLDLTSANLKVEAFNIGPEDSWDQADNEQPRVTFFLEIKGLGEKAELRPEIQIQTTVSQRQLDIQY
jgi:prepilin-type N-terminal cleavage/methylation domain-containing protein